MQETSTGIGKTNFCQRFLKDLKIYFAILTLDIELIQFKWIHRFTLIGSGYFKVFTLRPPPFSAKLRPHGRTAEKKVCSTSTPPPPAAASVAESIILEIIRGYIKGY